MDTLTKAILEIVEPKVNASIDALGLPNMVKNLVKSEIETSTKVVSISLDGGEPKKVGSIVHKNFETLLKMTACGVNVLMVGMAGTGKTHGAQSVAKALELPFHAISIGMQTTKSDVLGFVDANGRYVESSFYKAFKKGGIYLMDEIDAGNPNVLILVNSAISNGFCEFPNGEFIEAHKNFRFIGTANTFGNGSDGVFVGRNQLDLATLDRFCTIEWDIDEDVEDALVSDKAWLKIVRKCREIVAQNIDNSFVTQRASLNGDKLLVAGVHIETVLSATILKGFKQDDKNMILAHVTKELQAYKPAKKEEPKTEPKEVKVEEVKDKWADVEPEPYEEKEDETASSVMDW